MFTVRITLHDVEINVEMPPYAAEAGPEFYFESMQRVGHPTDPHADHRQADIDRIKRRFPGPLGEHGAMLRLLLDGFEAPSMSVGDTITVRHNGEDRVTYRCESIGWCTIAPAPQV